MSEKLITMMIAAVVATVVGLGIYDYAATACDYSPGAGRPAGQTIEVGR